MSKAWEHFTLMHDFYLRSTNSHINWSVHSAWFSHQPGMKIIKCFLLPLSTLRDVSFLQQGTYLFCKTNTSLAEKHARCSMSIFFFKLHWITESGGTLCSHGLCRFSVWTAPYVGFKSSWFKVYQKCGECTFSKQQINSQKEVNGTDTSKEKRTILWVYNT